MNTSHIDNARHHLIALHKAIIDAERATLEKLEGRLTAGEMLQRLVSDARLAWLAVLTNAIVQLDLLLEGEETAHADPLALARELLVLDENDTDPFRTAYARVLQESPDVVLAHAAAIGALTTASSPSARLTTCPPPCA